MNYFSENKDLYTTIFTALKNLGVKVPKIKNFKSCMPKQGKNSLSSETKMFGISLSKQEWTYDYDYPLPMFLAVSTAYLLKFSRTVGLFRKSGSITRQRNLRVKLESGESLEGSDPNDVASLLKQWLRELPELLIPHYMHDLFVRCQHLDNGDDRASASLLSCLLLSPEHLHPLKHLLCFLKKFAAHCSENKMGAHNLALMMAPNIFISKTESITKTCNSLIQLHTSVIQLLIENAEHVGEVPQTVSLQCSILDGRRGSELDSPADILDFSPSKSSKKLRSGPVHDLFSGIRKLVGQNTNPISSLKTLTPEKCWSSPKMSCRSASKSTAHFDQQLPAVKKPLFLNEAEKTFSTLNSEDTQTLLNNKPRTGSNRVRRKSFGLLRRKDRKRQKSNKSSQTKRSLVISKSSNFNTSIATDRMDSTFQGPTCPNESERKSPKVQFEQDAFKRESITKCRSDCNMVRATKELFILSTPTSHTSQSCLQHNSHIASSYWLQSDKNGETAGQSKTQQSESLHLNAGNNINQRKTCKQESLADNKLEHCNKLVLYSPNHNSVLTDLSYKHRHFSNSKISPTDSSLIDPQIHNFSKIILGKLDFYESTPKSEKSNYLRNVDSSTKSNLSQNNLQKDIDNTCKSKRINQSSVNNDPCKSKSNLTFDLSKSLKKKNNETENNLVCKAKIRQEAFVVKSKNKDKNTTYQMKSMDNNCRNNEKSGDLHRSKSFLMDSKWKNDLNEKVPKKTSRQSSLIRGKPNTIKSGLLYQHLNKTPNLTQDLELNKSEKLGHQIEKNTTFKISPSIDVSGKENEKYFSEQDISLILNSGNFDLSSPNVNDAPEINCESSVISKKSTPSKDTSHRITLNDGGLPLCPKNVSCHSDSKIPRLRHSLGSNRKDVPEISSDCKRKTRKLRLSGSICSTGHSRIPVLSKEKFNFSDLGSSMNDSCFLTPNQTLFNSPNSITWMSGNKYLSFNSPQEDDSFNKRESIALILKHNPGHVQAKVQLYNARVVKSCSTPSVATNNRKVSPCEEPMRSSSHKQLLPDSQKNRKTLSVSQSCDSSSKRISGKSRIKTPLKLPIPPPKFSIDKETPSPNISHPLKEVTNINFSFGAKQNPTRNITPIKDGSALQKPMTTSRQNCCNTDLNEKKLKRNSFSGHTPSKFSKRVSRSESSPSCPRPGNRLFKLIQESTLNSPNVSVEINNLHDSSFSPTHMLSYQPVKKSGSSLSIQKLKCNEMIDEWECEL